MKLLRISCSALFALSALTGCGDGRSTLVVDVITELCPDVAGGPRCLAPRFDTVAVSIDRGMRLERQVATSDRYLDGVRVAEIGDLLPGTYMVLIQLLQDGVVVARAARLVTVTGPLYVMRVAFQGECAGVICPAPGGNPIATECLGGDCVDPRCFDPMPPAGCGAICENDLECAPSVPCAQARCVEHACIETLDDAACPAGQRCVPETGCFGGALEGDPCTGDADCGASLICCGAFCRQPGCNDGNACTDDACGAGGCTNTPNGAPCNDLVFCNGADTCQAGACTQHAGSPCAAMSVCDEATTSCAGCLQDSDCPGPQESPITGCSGFTGECGENGTQTFRITTHMCTGTVCVPSTRDEPRACTVSRAGTPCGTGGMTCLSGTCLCGGALCSGSQYCSGGACWDYPRIEMIGTPDLSCVDGGLAPQPGLLAGYRLYGRPGALIHKYNQHASCDGGWMEAPETAGSATYIPASGVYEVLLDSATALACDFGEYGRWEQYAEVDGLRVPPAGMITQTWYNSGCPLVGTCLSGTTFCP